MAATKLGIIAGSGPLPARIARRCRDSGRAVFVIAIKGETDAATCADVAHLWVGLGQVGKLLKALRRENCGEVVLAGPIRRPALSEVNLDWRGVRLMGKVTKALSKGDDAVLSIIVQELESEGFKVVGADDLLGELPAPVGVLGAVAPDDEARADIALGVEKARAIGGADIGQAVIVQQGVVLGVEAAEGTDGLIARCAALKTRGGPGGVLVKVKKPGQERRTDLPTIGVRTVEAAAAAKLSGIAVEARWTLVMDREATVARADALGLFLIGVE